MLSSFPGKGLRVPRGVPTNSPLERPGQLATNRHGTDRSGPISETPSMTSLTLRRNRGPHLLMAKHYSSPLVKPTSFPAPPRSSSILGANDGTRALASAYSSSKGEPPVCPPHHPAITYRRACDLVHILHHRGQKSHAIWLKSSQFKGSSYWLAGPGGVFYLWTILYPVTPQIQDDATYAPFTPSRVFERRRFGAHLVFLR